MAVGDAVIEILGAAIENYQPSAGVEVQITAIQKGAVTAGNEIVVWDGSSEVKIFNGNVRTDLDIVDAVQAGMQSGKLAINIDNTYYLRKTNTSDQIVFCGITVG